MSRHREARAFLAEFLPADVAARALERIAERDETLGESYRSTSLAELVRELGEEPLDTISWSSILSARTDCPRARGLLGAIAQSAAESDKLVGELRRLLDGAR